MLELVERFVEGFPYPLTFARRPVPGRLTERLLRHYRVHLFPFFLFPLSIFLSPLSPFFLFPLFPFPFCQSRPLVLKSHHKGTLANTKSPWSRISAGAWLAILIWQAPFPFFSHPLTGPSRAARPCPLISLFPYSLFPLHTQPPRAPNPQPLPQPHSAGPES